MSTIAVVTLGVADLDRATAFYEALGWQRSAASVPGEVTFMQGHPVLALFGMTDLAADAAIDPPADGFGGISLGMNVAEAADVGARIEQAVAAGARVLKPSGETFWGGVSGYFADLDGHVWEVVWAPMFRVRPDGSLAQTTQEDLARLLAAAGQAHHAAFAAVNGEDPERPRWYAEWLRPRLADEGLAVPDAAELAAWLSDATSRHEADGSTQPWAEFSAGLLAERF